MFPRN